MPDSSERGRACLLGQGKERRAFSQVSGTQPTRFTQKTATTLGVQVCRFTDKFRFYLGVSPFGDEVGANP